MITELSPWWQGACVAQTAWSVAFARESILPCQILLPVVAGCMYKAYNIASAGASSQLETWLIAVPFGLHATWGLFAAFLQQNLAARKANNRRPFFGFGLEYPSLFLAAGLSSALSLKVESPLPALVALWSLRGIQKRSVETMPQIKANPKEWGLDSNITRTAGVLAAISAGLAVFLTARLHH